MPTKPLIPIYVEGAGNWRGYTVFQKRYNDRKAGRNTEREFIALKPYRTHAPDRLLQMQFVSLIKLDIDVIVSHCFPGGGTFLFHRPVECEHAMDVRLILPLGCIKALSRPALRTWPSRTNLKHRAPAAPSPEVTNSWSNRHITGCRDDQNNQLCPETRSHR